MLDDAIDMALDVMLNRNANPARPQKLEVAAAGRDFIGLAFLKHLILLQPGQRAVVPALEQWVREELRDDRLIGDLHAWHKEQRLVAVHRVVVDQHDGFGAQLDRFD